jgi:hypothetical protein
MKGLADLYEAEPKEPPLPLRVDYRAWSENTVNDLRNPEVCEIINDIINNLEYLRRKK